MSWARATLACPQRAVASIELLLCPARALLRGRDRSGVRRRGGLSTRVRGQMAHGKLQCDAVRQAQRKTATASSTPAAGSTCFPSTATDPNRDRLDPRNPAGPQITVIERSSLPGRRAPGLACLVAISAAPDHADAASSSQATSPHSLWESASPSGACPCAAFSRARRHAQARAAGPVRYQGRGHSTCHQMPRGARSSSGHVRWSGVSTATR